MKRICIVQSCYLPWMGFFDMLSRSQEYIALDCAQYTKRDWRNRNYFKFHSGPGRLTVPVVKGARTMPIESAEIAGDEWAQRHWKSLCQAYAKAPYFASYRGYFDPVFADPPRMLSALNRALIAACCACLGITTKLSASTDYGRFAGKNERLIALCNAAGATHYLSGPAAQDYLDEAKFNAAGIEVEWMRYEYPQYRQQHGPFVARLSVLDLIFNEGPNAMAVIKGEQP